MKRFVPMCVILAGALLLMAVQQDALAADPSMHLKVVGKTQNQRGGPWRYSSGLQVTGKGSRVYVFADTTGSEDAVVNSFSWSLASVPGGSSATFDSGASNPVYNSFIPDQTGSYTIVVTANAVGGSKSDTVDVFASTYVGNTGDPLEGCVCHVGVKKEYFDKWAKTPHATMLKRGMTGEMEVVEETGQGLYANSCTNCHGVAPDTSADNGNYAFLAHTLPAAPPNSWDATWFQGLPLTADGRDVMITTGSQKLWLLMPAEIKQRATIGCENCHGPANDHKNTGDPKKLAVSRRVDPCNACHDGSRRHSLGSWVRVSIHQTGGTFEEEGDNRSCAPCHSGSGFIDWVKGGKVAFPSNYVTPADYPETPIGCPTCHDPHDTLNLDMAQLRTVEVTLSNGFTPPGKAEGYLCMNCHRARSAVGTYVKDNSPPYYGFKSRFYPHHSNQGDMLFGQNGYEYGDSVRLRGLNTHAGIEGACAGCHMSPRPTGSGNTLPNHSWSMDPADYANPGINPLYNPATACERCHNGVEDYADIKAAWDYDDDQVVEAAEAEVDGMMEQLKMILPKNTEGEVIGGGTVTAADSAAIYNRLDLVAGIWTYWFVYEDRSHGMHNMKYAVQLLGKALNLKWADISRDDFTTPIAYSLSQNYPNPFNPSTTIQFSVPDASPVRIDIYDVTGQHISTLVNTHMSAGNYRMTWNGDDANGARVSSGMYLYRMQAGSFVMTKKMLLLK